MSKPLYEWDPKELSDGDLNDLYRGLVAKLAMVADELVRALLFLVQLDAPAQSAQAFSSYGRWSHRQGFVDDRSRRNG
jgi:hypothetical protein